MTNFEVESKNIEDFKDKENFLMATKQKEISIIKHIKYYITKLHMPYIS